MSPTKPCSRDLKPSDAARVAGLGYLLTPTPFAEFYVWPRLVIPGSAAQTEHNILAHHNLFAVGILCYLLSYVLDVVIAWALYYMLKPVSRPVSALAALFQLIYTATGLTASLNLVNVSRLLNAPADNTAFGVDASHWQMDMLLSSFHATWGLSLIFFGIHLTLVGYLIFKSGYIPRLIGILVAIAGLGYIIQNLTTTLFPVPNLDDVGMALAGELIFMFWLLFCGPRIRHFAAGEATAGRGNP